ncbi:MerR family transcriptional regulator [Bradyrhizobium liaoningense]
MKIGELARRTGVSVRMLRYYEERGLISPQRSISGYRDYASADEAAIRRVRLLGRAGLTLGTIAAILPCVTTDKIDFVPCADLRRILSDQVARLDNELDDIKRSRKILLKYLASASKPEKRGSSKRLNAKKKHEKSLTSG